MPSLSAIMTNIAIKNFIFSVQQNNIALQTTAWI
jgi:hypothetical protein